MKNKIFGIFVILISIFAFCIFPAIEGMENSHIFENICATEQHEKNYNIVEFLKKIKNQDDATVDEVFYELKVYYIIIAMVMNCHNSNLNIFIIILKIIWMKMILMNS